MENLSGEPCPQVIGIWAILLLSLAFYTHDIDLEPIQSRAYVVYDKC